VIEEAYESYVFEIAIIAELNFNYSFIELKCPFIAYIFCGR